MDDRELLTVSQVAEALNASSQTIRNWIRAEQLHGVRIGNRFLIPRGELDRLRGGISGGYGEGPWDLGEEGVPTPPLPRATDRRADGGTEGLLGG